MPDNFQSPDTEAALELLGRFHFWFMLTFKAIGLLAAAWFGWYVFTELPLFDPGEPPDKEIIRNNQFIGAFFCSLPFAFALLYDIVRGTLRYIYSRSGNI